MAYNRMAGQSLERIAALSDGLFAIAMTLTYWSIAFIVVVQVNFVIAPRIPGLSRL